MRSDLAPRSLEEWLEFQTQAHPQAIDLNLTRPRAVLERLQWRRPAVPVITVAGTNGKGSVVATAAAVLKAAGHRVGVFTSPHFRDYRERLRIDDREVGTEALVAAFERIEAARGAAPLTFFEYNTLAALLLFEAAALDAWVLEIGLGGRLDAVNLVDPDVAVVTSIGLDHMDFLGSTLEAIGREKAGIFRSGRPAILGSRTMPVSVEAAAKSIGAPLKRLGHEFDYTIGTQGWRYHGPRWELDLPPPVLPGEIQYGNAATALAALEELDARLASSPAAIATGLLDVRLVGRFQVIPPARHGGPTWILDVAHNADAAQVLAANLRATRGAGRTLAVCGILVDKDAHAVVAALRGVIDRWCCVTTGGDRGRSGASLSALVAGVAAVPTAAFGDVAGACSAALLEATGLDRIVVFGSFHVVGPALDWLEGEGLMPREDHGTAC